MIPAMLPVLATCALLLAQPSAAAAPVQDPPAQSMNDLRQEIDRLNAEIARRDEELAKAKDRISELETAIAALRSVPASRAWLQVSMRRCWRCASSTAMCSLP